MPVEQIANKPDDEQPKRQIIPAMMKGARGKCPCCGMGNIFSSGLTIQDNCTTCGETLHHHRADDLPAYLNIFLIGHVVVAFAIIMMDLEIFGLWTLVGLCCGLALAFAFLLMRPVKGMVVAMQWALRMHGFGNDDRKVA